MQEQLEMIRGDTLRFKFQRKTEQEEVIKEPVDEMYITFKKSVYSKGFLFQKSLKDKTITYDETTGYYRIVIEPKDTENLSYDDYVFDIEITTDNIVKTIIKGVLTLTEEVTFGCNKEVQND